LAGPTCYAYYVNHLFFFRPNPNVEFHKLVFAERCVLQSVEENFFYPPVGDYDIWYVPTRRKLKKVVDSLFVTFSRADRLLSVRIPMV